MNGSRSPERDVVVGIDLGTTNSEVAAFVGDRVRVLGPGRRILPSCVGISPSGELLVGEAARNQLILYPESTVKSIKRKMGTTDKVTLSDRTFTPPEVSALILKELAAWAQRQLGCGVKKAVITVPAYFSDAQRNATREAGALAGLEVVRILNEPTAASLAYGTGDSGQTVLVYDLGGGTFDVSVVTTQKDVTEVLASHGNNHLGGDDFDQLLLARLLAEFKSRHGVDLREGHRVALARLNWAAEEAKKTLSSAPSAVVREEALVVDSGRPLDLELAIAREEFEEMIRPLVESTLDSVTRALADAGKKPQELDAVLLVGGATRTPLVSRILSERFGFAPKQEVDPDLCVALGAGTLGARLSGQQVDRVLVDVSPYSFGPSYLGERDGMAYPHCYHPIIRRNTALPVTRSDRYCTSHPYQEVVHLFIYQGDDPDALRNVPVGDFQVTGLTTDEEPNEVRCTMSLDLDGILKVEAIETKTGLSKKVVIDGACRPRAPEEIAAARERLGQLFAQRAVQESDGDVELDPDDVDETEEERASPGAQPGEPADDGEDPAWAAHARDARALLERSRGMLARLHPDDREEAIELDSKITAALGARNAGALAQATTALADLLFYVESR